MNELGYDVEPRAQANTGSSWLAPGTNVTLTSSRVPADTNASGSRRAMGVVHERVGRAVSSSTAGAPAWTCATGLIEARTTQTTRRLHPGEQGELGPVVQTLETRRWDAQPDHIRNLQMDSRAHRRARRRSSRTGRTGPRSRRRHPGPRIDHADKCAPAEAPIKTAR